jgi:hypothetical protein
MHQQEIKVFKTWKKEETVRINVGRKKSTR